TTYLEWEQLNFGLTGVDVATMILDEWRFPAELVTAIEQHLTPKDDAFARILNLAGAIVVAHNLALPGEVTAWALTPDKLAAAGIEEGEWQAARDQAFTAFARQRPALY